MTNLFLAAKVFNSLFCLLFVKIPLVGREEILDFFVSFIFLVASLLKEDYLFGGRPLSSEESI